MLDIHFIPGAALSRESKNILSISKKRNNTRVWLADAKTGRISPRTFEWKILLSFRVSVRARNPWLVDSCEKTGLGGTVRTGARTQARRGEFPFGYRTASPGWARSNPRPGSQRSRDQYIVDPCRAQNEDAGR